MTGQTGAMQFSTVEDYFEILAWMKACGDTYALANEVMYTTPVMLMYATPIMLIKTPMGTATANPGDWIERAEDGTFRVRPGDLVEAFTHLRRLVDHQDDDCVFYRGDCQAHFTAGSEPGKCGTAEARAWLAEHDTNGGNRA
jgi:hypothetical protein